jgi:DNA transposition AAA+ family ATPase
MISVKKALELTGMSMSQMGTVIGLSKSTISLIVNNKYGSDTDKEKEIIEKLVALGYLTKEDAALNETKNIDGPFRVKSNSFIITENTMKLDELAKDLLSVKTTLNSSIGVVYSHAGYGKSTAIQHFCALNSRAVYSLYMEGYSLTMMVKDIVNQLQGTPAHGLDKNIELIKESCFVYRKLLVVDEADRLPIKNIEMLRNINEKCRLPILLVGEHSLSGKMTSLPRLESRIRSKPLVFQPLSLQDIANFYNQSCGLDISNNKKVLKRILQLCHGDFRVMVNDAHQILAVMNANRLSEITMEVIHAIDR